MYFCFIDPETFPKTNFLTDITAEIQMPRSYFEVFSVRVAPLTMAVDIVPTERQHVYLPGVGGIIERLILRRITHPLCTPACVFVFSGSLLSGVRNK